MLKRILFAAGGTGGHIYPAIAVADELRKLDKNIEIEFIGAKGRIEEKIVPQNGYKLQTIVLSGFSRSLNPKNIKVVLNFLEAVRKSKKMLREFKPDIVYGTGGFVSGPVLWAATKLNIKTVIEEGNSYPGVTVKWLASKVDRVILNFEETKKHLKRKDNISMMSYPVRQNMQRIPKKEACAKYGLDETKKVILAFGGSQGAHSINTALLGCLEKFSNTGIQLIWQTGKKDFESIQQQAASYSNICTMEYIDNIQFAYSAADLVICRSGVSTIMELADFGLAALFVPFGHSAENHQEKNARALVDKDAAEIILDKELNEKFESTVIALITDENRLENMRRNIKTFADKDAAIKIALSLIELANN